MLRAWVEELGRCGCHSVMLLRGGAVVLKAFWAPYKEDIPHIQFSVSKTFVTAAMGMAAAEGLLQLDEKLVDIFPERFSTPPCETMRRVTIEHLLTMSMGHTGRTDADFLAEPSWIEEGLHRYLENEPGSNFFYDNMCSYLCCAILQKRSGMTLHDYLRAKLFPKIGISESSWEVSADGCTTGGWGLRIQTEAMARFGQFWLQGGAWEGKQILPQWFHAAATANHIDTRHKSVLKTEDCWQGYGYFIWHSPFKGAYRADGALGQCIIVMPDQDAVVAMTAGTATRNTLLEATWKHLCPAFDNVCPDKEDAQKALDSSIAALRLEPAQGAPAGNLTFGKAEYAAECSALGITRIAVELGKEDIVSLHLADGGTLRLPAGHGQWADNNAPVSYEGGSDMTRVLYERAAASAGWEGNTLTIKIAYIPTPFVDTMTITFHDHGIRCAYECGPAFRFREGRYVFTGYQL